MSGGEAPQFHQLPSEGQPQVQGHGQGQGPRPEREGEEHRRGRRNRGGRDRDRNRGDRGDRGDRPREEHSPAAAALAEQQRRIHELESRAEQTRQEEPHHEQPRYEPPAPPPVEEPRVEQPRPEQPRVDPKELLKDAGLVMIETDRTKVQVQAPVSEEPQHLGRPRRERSKPLPQDDELQQVETRK